uniref:C-X-C motif chemokine ligand 12 n=1 Tax=Sus scrofa TaxID=9823 RepID=A0A4X1VD14_PIG
MGVKVLAVLALVLTALCLSDEKPVSLSYRCPCRFFESHVARANIKHLKILNTPNCALQIVLKTRQMESKNSAYVKQWIRPPQLSTCKAEDYFNLLCLSRSAVTRWMGPSCGLHPITLSLPGTD